MATLASELRSKLERVVIDARDAAETGARAALQTLAVHEREAYPNLKEQPELLQLRNALRARARQLGDRQDSSGCLTIDHLVAECAYEHWHRMLFARFLAENGLLIEPQENVAISLAEAEELAKEEGVDVWVFASRCAQQMLPQIFRPDDPLLQVRFATEHMLGLEKLLASLPDEVFGASDALGWVYQFWQSKKKDEVNRSEVKIGADEIAAVTQLFTEPYMVAFLLHNTLGAWWAGRKLTADDAESAETEEALRKKLSLPGVSWEYLRFVRGADGKGGPWRPAAGTFDGWPKSAAELKLLDPCCGSGHFLVAGMHHLVPIRMAEEGLSAAAAIDAVLRDNLHGLEIDERCCQIAAFALAFAAWTYPGAGGYRPLPRLNIAHTGIAIGSTRDQWMRILEDRGDQGLRFFFGELYDLFRKAPALGSLINPQRFLGGGMLKKEGMESLLHHLQTAIADDPNAGPEKHELGIAAQGLARAANLLADRYMLVFTNVPYLGRGKQNDILKEHLETQYPLGKADLATAFVLRCLEFCAKDGAIALVTPQNWLFLTTYTNLRKTLLDLRQWNLVARLGAGAFETIGGHVVNVALLALSATTPGDQHAMSGIDVSDAKLPEEKAALLRGDQPADITVVRQAEQLKNPDARVTTRPAHDMALLAQYGAAYVGILNGDSPRFIRSHWEITESPDWRGLQSTVDKTIDYGGRERIIYWQNGDGDLRRLALELQERLHDADRRGNQAWGKSGVAVSQMGSLAATLYSGDLFDSNATVVVLNNDSNLPALWSFCSSPSFVQEVRRIDQKVNVTNATVAKVPFDLGYWQRLAAEKYPNGLPEPESDDPTQWLFHGWPRNSTAPLHVAVARLLGYRWPAELDDKMRLSTAARALVKRSEDLTRLVDADGIACIPSVRGEEPAAERLEALLAAAGVNAAKARELAGGTDLDDWLRNGFFEEHCRLFHDRPFVWHIWDGRKRDGFHALVNCHKLCEAKGKGRKLLESLTYSYLGEWITRQKDGVKRGEGGAEDRLAAALELQARLEAILAGEPPFDLFIRWKSLAQQPIGWEPDINDGVRMNIRPFLASDLPAGRAGAGVLRSKPNIKWDKDRGKEPKRPIREFPWFWGWDGSVDYTGGPLASFTGERFNACHYSTELKHRSRQQAEGRRNAVEDAP